METYYLVLLDIEYAKPVSGYESLEDCKSKHETFLSNPDNAIMSEADYMAWRASL